MIVRWSFAITGSWINIMDYIELGWQELSVRPVSHIFNLITYTFVRARVRVMGIYEFYYISNLWNKIHTHIYLKTQLEATWCQTRFLNTSSNNYNMFTGHVIKALILFKQSGLHDKYEHQDKWIKLYTTQIDEFINNWDYKNSQNLSWKKNEWEIRHIN